MDKSIHTVKGILWLDIERAASPHVSEILNIGLYKESIEEELFTFPRRVKSIKPYLTRNIHGLFMNKGRIFQKTSSGVEVKATVSERDIVLRILSILEDSGTAENFIACHGRDEVTLCAAIYRANDCLINSRFETVLSGFLDTTVFWSKYIGVKRHNLAELKSSDLAPEQAKNSLLHGALHDAKSLATITMGPNVIHHLASWVDMVSRKDSHGFKSYGEAYKDLVEDYITTKNKKRVKQYDTHLSSLY